VKLRLRRPGAPRAGSGPAATTGPGSRERLIRLRLMLVGLSMCLWALVVVARLFALQVLAHDGYARQAARQSERTINLEPRRGPIMDRHGHTLAVSVDAESLYAVPSGIEDKAGTTEALARALELDRAETAELRTQLARNRAFVWVRRKLAPDTAEAIRRLQLPGVGFLKENRRYYPHREMAAHVLGYVGLDDKGMSGVEYALDDQIRGKGAKVVIRIDARRRPVGHTDKPSTEGRGVVLTIDEAIQHVVERELERVVQETGSVAGMAIVMDPRTGEILALANQPTYNPNRFQAAGPARWRNRAVVDAYEPGSIFKIVTAAAGLQEKVVTADEVLDCGGGFIEIAGRRINDHHVFHQLSFRDVMAKSSDVGVIRVAQRVGKEPFERYLHEFGFGSITGVELPGESPGLLRPRERWSALSLPTLSFGQEVGVTALQMTTAVAAVANGGYLMKPSVVKRIVDGEGRTVRATEPAVVRRVLEPETVAVLTGLLEEVVKGGTGVRAAIPGYTVAGKTGTAQKVDASGRYSMIDHWASFVGFAPSRAPAAVVLVSLDEPKGALNEGGHVAAPLFAKIMEATLRRLAVPAEVPERTLRAAAPAGDVVARFASHGTSSEQTAPLDGVMPDLHGLTAREAAVTAARRGLQVRLEGTGAVVDQVPAAGAMVEPGQGVTLSLEPSWSRGGRQ
jgi:cell division protein FtsI (penicillin-binding protein 3)